MSSVDITKRNTQGHCDLKCTYSFQYPISNSMLTNKGIYLSLSYDAATMAPVTYNQQPYGVSQIHIYAPSLHLFNGTQTTAEIIIIHSPQKGGDNLYVAIPITTNGANQSQASTLIGQIIDQAATSAPAEGDTVTLSIPNFSLNDIVPSKRPFFTYTGINVNDDYESPYIIFGMESAIALTTDAADKLTKIIAPYGLTMTGGALFLNPKGANSLAADQTGDLYISCAPTTASDETVEVTSTTKNPTIFNWSEAFKDPAWRTVLQAVVAIAICVAVYGAVYWGYGKFVGGGGATTASAAAQQGGHRVRFASPISRSKRI